MWTEAHAQDVCHPYQNPLLRQEGGWEAPDYAWHPTSHTGAAQ